MKSSSKLVLLTGLLLVILLVFSGFASAQWAIEVVDTGKLSSRCTMTVDSQGRPHIVYFSYSDGLKYAWWNGTDWEIQTVDSDADGGWSHYSIALDDQNRPHISYRGLATRDLKYASWGGTGWDIESIDTTGADTSIALDSSGYPHIVYKGYSNLKYARWDGESWAIQTVDENTVQHASMVLDSDGHPHIGYYDYDTKDLKYAWWNGTDWEIQTVEDLVAVGWTTSIAVDSQDRPHISYVFWRTQVNSTGDLRYARLDGVDWEIQTVEGGGLGLGASSSIAIDSQDLPRIGYIDYRGGASPTIKYAQWDGTNWEIQSLVSGNVSKEWGSMALDYQDRPHITFTSVFHTYDTNLYYARWIPEGPTTGTISGKVTDSSIGDGISGATVSVDGSTTTTDAQGNYSLSLPEGTYTVAASADGYESQTKDNIVVSDGSAITLDFSLEPTAVPQAEIVDFVNNYEPKSPFDILTYLDQAFQIGMGVHIADVELSIAIEEAEQVEALYIVYSDQNTGVFSLSELDSSDDVYKVHLLLSKPIFDVKKELAWFVVDVLIHLAGGGGPVVLFPRPGEAIYPYAGVIEQVVLIDKQGQEIPCDVQDIRIPSVYYGFFSTWVETDEGYELRPTFLVGDYAYVVWRSPADLLIIDAQGRRTGTLHEEGTEPEVLHEIPGALYSGPDEEPEFVLIAGPNVDDGYILRLTGTGEGQGSLSYGGYGQTIPSIFEEEEIHITQGEQREYGIQFVSTVPMTSFVIEHAKVDFKKKPDDDKVSVKGSLELNLVNGDGVDISEDVIVTVGPFSETIRMEEKGKKGDKWEYNRPKGSEGNIKKMSIDWEKGTFDFSMDKADLTVVTNPVTISIKIGDDVDQETILMEEENKWEYKAETEPVASFAIEHAKIDLKKKADDDKVSVKGNLGDSFNNVDISEDVIVTVGPFSETIRMEEKGKKGDKWEYNRPKGSEGNIKKMSIDWEKGTFDFSMDKADLTVVTNPVTISIKIGDDVAEETILMEEENKWEYKAEAIKSSMASKPEEDIAQAGSSLSQNYPNPFNPETTIEYSLAESCNVTLKIYNIAGRLIKTLIDEYQTAGSYSITWYGDNEVGEEIASGVYFYRIQVADFVSTKKMVVLK